MPDTTDILWVREATMRRRLELRYREGFYVSPVARRVMDLLIEGGNSSDSGHDQGWLR